MNFRDLGNRQEIVVTQTSTVVAMKRNEENGMVFEQSVKFSDVGKGWKKRENLKMSAFFPLKQLDVGDFIEREKKRSQSVVS